MILLITLRFCNRNSYEFVVSLEMNATSFYHRVGQVKRSMNTPEKLHNMRNEKRAKRLFSTPDKMKSSVKDTACFPISPINYDTENTLNDSFQNLSMNEQNVMSDISGNSNSDHQYCETTSTSTSYQANIVSFGGNPSFKVNVDDCNAVKIKEITTDIKITEALDMLSTAAKSICSRKVPSVLRDTGVDILSREDLVQKCLNEMNER